MKWKNKIESQKRPIGYSCIRLQKCKLQVTQVWCWFKFKMKTTKYMYNFLMVSLMEICKLSPTWKFALNSEMLSVSTNLEHYNYFTFPNGFVTSTKCRSLFISYHNFVKLKICQIWQSWNIWQIWQNWNHINDKYGIIHHLPELVCSTSHDLDIEFCYEIYVSSVPLAKSQKCFTCTLSVKRNITSSERGSLKSTASKLIIFRHR